MSLVCPLHKSGDDTFIRVVTRVIHAYDIKMIGESGRDVPVWEADYVAAFYSSSQATITQKWISEGMTVPVKDISAVTAKMVLPFWDRLFE